MVKITWTYDPEYDVHNAHDDESRQLLAWIAKRNEYCDRGHFIGHINIGGLDHQDCWPNYYMRLDRAKDEITDFINWRLNKIRCEQVIDIGTPSARVAADRAIIEGMVGETGDHRMEDH